MSTTIESRLLKRVRVVNDFPKPGIAFRDITTLLADPALSKQVLAELAAAVTSETQAIAGVESRGFLFGMALAMELQLPFIPIRKKGKLPRETVSVSYALEYGSALVEVHHEDIATGMKVHIHDDLLATGGSALAAAQLVTKCGGQVSGFSFLLGITDLNGDAILATESSNITILARC